MSWGHAYADDHSRMSKTLQLYLNAQGSVKGAMLSSDNSIEKGKIRLQKCLIFSKQLEVMDV